MSQKILKAGEKLFQEGDQSKSAYFVKKGMIRIFKKKGDQNIEIETIRAGQLIGELAFLDAQPRSASAEAMTETELVEISQAILDETLTKTPEWLKALLKTISNRLRNSTNKIKTLESASVAYETDVHGTRSREFTYINRGEFLRFCTGILVTASRFGEPATADGIRFPAETLTRYTNQVLQLNEGKIIHLIELFKTVHLFKEVVDADPKAAATVLLTDIAFMDKLIWFVNEQNLKEASKQRTISERGFILLGLIVKNLKAGTENKDGGLSVNMAPVIGTAGKMAANPPLRADELQELFDQGFVDSISVGSTSEVTVNVHREHILFEFRVFWILSELDILNEQKRKTK